MPNGNTFTGNFTRMFPYAEATNFDKSKLIKLADRLQESYLRLKGPLAGYTYFGQFIAHDLTHLKGSEETSHGNPEALADLELICTPTLDLSGVYGEGFFDPAIRVERETGKFSLGYCQKTKTKLIYGGDIPRGPNKEPQIADPRNDANLILAQLHLQFLKLHNLIVDDFSVRSPELNPIEKFNSARVQLILLYQEAVFFDYLKKMLNPMTWRKIILQNNSYVWEHKPPNPLEMPIEFSAAAFRFGHTMLRKRYDVQQGVRLNLDSVLKHTGLLGLGGTQFLQSKKQVNWNLFFDLSSNQRVTLANGIRPSTSLDINVPGRPKLSGPIGLKNLLRGNQVGLPSAQNIINDITEHYSVDPEIKPSLLAREEINPKDTNEKPIMDESIASVFTENTPLWYYILAESLNEQDGKRLGKLGSLIVAETFKNVLQESTPSIFKEGFAETNLLNRNAELALPDYQLMSEDIRPQHNQFVTITDLLRLNSGM